MDNTRKILENKLNLKVNKDKSEVRAYNESKFLGFTFYKNSKSEVQIIPHSKSKTKFKNKIREFKFSFNESLFIGISTTPRAEVTLIIANLGLTSGLIGNDIFTGVVMLVSLSTIVTPLLLKKIKT